MPVRDVGEVGPDLVVEEMLAEDIQHLERADQLDRAAPESEHVVGEEADVFHVIEVRVGDEDVVDLALFFEAESASGGASVDQDVPVDQEAGGLKTGRHSPVGTQHAKFQKPLPENDRFNKKPC